MMDATVWSGLIPSDAEGLALFWRVYDEHYDAINGAMTGALAAHPEIAALLGSIPEDVRVQQDRESRERTRRAVEDGEWDELMSNLAEQGGMYAQQGMSFEAWMAIIIAFRAEMIGRLAAAYAGDVDQTARSIVAMDSFGDAALAVIGDAYLTEKTRVIQGQQEAIRELATPVLSVRPEVLILPLIGMIDSDRARQVTEQLLEAVVRTRAKAIVIDITGVPAVDSMVANHLIQTADAARLMGARVIITGISTANAQTLVRIGVDPDRLDTVGDLQSGIEEAERLLGRLPAGADAS